EHVAGVCGYPRIGLGLALDATRELLDGRESRRQLAREDDSDALAGRQLVRVFDVGIELPVFLPRRRRAEVARGDALQRVAGLHDVPADRIRRMRGDRGEGEKDAKRNTFHRARSRTMVGMSDRLRRAP